MPRTILIAVMVLAAGCTNIGGTDTTPATAATTTTSAVESTTSDAATSTTSTAPPTTTTLVDDVVEIDMWTVVESAKEASPDRTLVLPWGDGVGEVAKNEIAGPHSIDVAPDGTVYLADVLNGRIQRFDGESWSVFVDYGTSGTRQPFGVAALDSGEVAVQVRDLSGTNTTATIEMFDADGQLLDSTLAPVITNYPFGGGTNAWTAYGVGPTPTAWLQLSSGTAPTEFPDAVLDDLNESWEQALFEGDLVASMNAAVAAGYQPTRADGDLKLTISHEFVSRTTFLPIDVVAEHTGDVVRLTIMNWADAEVVPSEWDISPDGVVFAATREGREIFAVLCDYGGECVSLRTPREQWRETNTWDWARLAGRNLYLLQTDESGARIEIFEM